ncbi:MAG: Dihydroorotate dehydrogenase (quinone), mitochondrial [Pycnora praestabilis]|nr:MAG: Dihydroorotate dehydrogenase (quinone), mitochondrial [Pycnora praestabilis]
MNPPILKAGRLSLRRSVQRRQNPHFKVTKNQKSTTPDRPSEPVNATVEDPAAGKTIPAQNNVSPLPLWQRLGPLSTAFHAYGRSQKKRPYITQSKEDATCAGYWRALLNSKL